ncbi:efflux RND transporter periplasmic adaptor subunit [Vagococcus sp. JNUCC 83]
MAKKKKWIIGSIVGLVVVSTVGGKLLLSKKEPTEITKEPKIEFFTVENVDQVFINGVVTPVMSKEFTKDTTLGKLGDLNVKNGENVTKDTVLYQYLDETTDSQIRDLKFQIESTQAEKEKAARQMQLEINEMNNVSTTESGDTQSMPVSKESIELKYDLASYDIKINQLQTQINELSEKQINKVVAPFDGQVIIPQDQNRDSAILTLSSTDFYVEGSVNEKDLDKVKEKQQADVKTVADNKLYKGEVTYVSNIPNTQQSSEGSSGGGTSNSLSTYTVKLSLKDAKAIRKGFHVQASVKLNDEKIEIPKKAVKVDDKTKEVYVLVDDFGTIEKRIVETSDQGASQDKVIITSGLEGLDKVIVSSDTELVVGEPTPGGESSAEGGNQ